MLSGYARRGTDCWSWGDIEHFVWVRTLDIRLFQLRFLNGYLRFRFLLFLHCSGFRFNPRDFPLRSGENIVNQIRLFRSCLSTNSFSDLPQLWLLEAFHVSFGYMTTSKYSRQIVCGIPTFV